MNFPSFPRFTERLFHDIIAQTVVWNMEIKLQKGMDTIMKQTSLLFGAAYYDEYLPCDRIDTDMKLLKEAGMNVIRIAESTWSTWEPQDNVFDFTHLHRMLDAAVKYDINVIVGTPTYAIPAWLAKKHPDILSVTKDGPSLYGHRQLTDITNPHYLHYAERMIRRLMEEVKDCPKVIGYQLDNETRSAGAASPETQALFVAKHIVISKLLTKSLDWIIGVTASLHGMIFRIFAERLTAAFLPHTSVF
jgi:beta-galactosidase GanA